jgi:membrane protease YdiL (CAAX protease family)
MWSPAVAAYLTVKIRRLDSQVLGLAWGDDRYAALGYVTPLAYIGVGYGLVWLLGFGTFPDPQALAGISQKFGWTTTDALWLTALYFVLLATTTAIETIALGLGEEIGWRGLLTPMMVDRFGFIGASVLIGVIWALWHMPILLFANYNSATPWWFAASCFLVLTISLSVMLTWFRLKSNSVWPCAIMHGAHNLFIHRFFTPLTQASGTETAYAIDEFGIAVPAVSALVAVGFYLRWKSARELAAVSENRAQMN